MWRAAHDCTLVTRDRITPSTVHDECIKMRADGDARRRANMLCSVLSIERGSYAPNVN